MKKKRTKPRNKPLTKFCIIDSILEALTELASSRASNSGYASNELVHSQGKSVFYNANKRTFIITVEELKHERNS